jgi:hypothetical protein
LDVEHALAPDQAAGLGPRAAVMKALARSAVVSRTRPADDEGHGFVAAAVREKLDRHRDIAALERLLTSPSARTSSS